MLQTRHPPFRVCISVWSHLAWLQDTAIHSNSRMLPPSLPLSLSRSLQASNLTKEEWAAVRSYMGGSIGRPRRFSASFVRGRARAWAGAGALLEWTMPYYAMPCYAMLVLHCVLTSAPSSLLVLCFVAVWGAGELAKLEAYRRQVRSSQYSSDPPLSEFEFPYQVRRGSGSADTYIQ